MNRVDLKNTGNFTCGVIEVCIEGIEGKAFSILEREKIRTKYD